MRLRTRCCAMLIVSCMTLLFGCKRADEKQNSEMKDTSSMQKAQVLPAGATEAAQTHTLDGRTFEAECKESGKATGDKDELTFSDGRFHSKGCDQYGFGDAPYTSIASGENTTFAAATASPKEGKISWTGTVKGDALEGKMIWMKDGQAPIEYIVTGAVKK